MTLSRQRQCAVFPQNPAAAIIAPMEPTLRIKITLVDGTIIELEKVLSDAQAFVREVPAHGFTDSSTGLFHPTQAIETVAGGHIRLKLTATVRSPRSLPQNSQFATQGRCSARSFPRRCRCPTSPNRCPLSSLGLAASCSQVTGLVVAILLQYREPCPCNQLL